MDEKKVTNIGCGKLLLILCAVVLVVVILDGAFTGIWEALEKIPWYGQIILSIGFVYLIYKAYDL